MKLGVLAKASEEKKTQDEIEIQYFPDDAYDKHVVIM